MKTAKRARSRKTRGRMPRMVVHPEGFTVEGVEGGGRLILWSELEVLRATIRTKAAERRARP